MDDVPDATAHERFIGIYLDFLRELFVWVDPPSATAAALFSVDPWRSSVASAVPPRLPPEASGVWAALWSDGQILLANALWRGNADGWEVVDPPAAGATARA
jgi:hypothetical protein